MAIKVGSAYGDVSLNMRGLLDAVRLGKSAMKDLSMTALQMGEILGNVGQKMTVGLTLPLLAMGGGALKMAKDYEDAKNRAVVVFGEMADEVVENADKSTTALGISRREYLDYAATLTQALKAGGMGVKQALDLSGQAISHFADIALFHKAQVKDVAAAWQSAIQGQFEPLRKYLPMIGNEFLISYGVANRILDANTSKLTDNQRAVILNAIALDERLNPALKNFSEATNNLTKETTILKAEFQKSLELLGHELLPMAIEATKALTDLVKAFNSMSPESREAVIGLGIFLMALGPILKAISGIIFLAKFLSGLGTIFSGLGITMGTIASAAKLAWAAFVTIGSAIASVIVAILLIVGAVALLYWAFKTNFMGITDTAKQLWFIIKHYFTLMVNWIVDSFRKVKWSDLGKNMLFGIANGMLAGIPSMVAAAIKAAGDTLKAFDSKFKFGSPSKVMEQRGMWSAMGYINGWTSAMSPNAVASQLARPAQNISSVQSGGNVFHFAHGLTLRDANNLMDEKISLFAKQMTENLGST